MDCCPLAASDVVAAFPGMVAFRDDEHALDSVFFLMYSKKTVFEIHGSLQGTDPVLRYWLRNNKVQERIAFFADPDLRVLIKDLKNSRMARIRFPRMHRFFFQLYKYTAQKRPDLLCAIPKQSDAPVLEYSLLRSQYAIVAVSDVIQNEVPYSVHRFEFESSILFWYVRLFGVRITR